MAASTSQPEPEPRRGHKAGKALHNRYVPFTADGLSLAFSPPDSADSQEVAGSFLQWLIAPLSVDSFYAGYFERRPFALLRSHAASTGKVKFVTTRSTLPALLKARLASPPAPSSQDAVDAVEEEVDGAPVLPSASSSPASSSSSPLHYYSGWFSKADILFLAASPSSSLHYSRDVDVTSYRDGQRSTLNPPNSPLVTLPSLSSFLSRGCSVRFLSPQSHHPPLQRLLHLLDQALGLQCGANSYLTPRGTQGFSPHYDDVDVFILQTEGRKRWRLYEPLDPSHLLPHTSSPNFSQSQLGRCVLDVWLHAGDFLYAPRGTVHQCVASEEEDSLHVTVSSCLRASWGDYLQALLQRAVERAKAGDAAFRRVLPRHFHRYMGAQHADRDDDRREAFMDQTLQLIERLLTSDETPFDAAADEMALDYMHGRIQPVLLPAQQARSRAGRPEFKLRATTLVRTLEAGLMRLTPSPEEGSVRVHHVADNEKGYKAAPLGSVDVDEALAGAVEAIIDVYPQWVQVGELPFGNEGEEGEEEKGEDEDEETRVQELVHLCQALYNSGLLEASDDQSLGSSAVASEVADEVAAAADEAEDDGQDMEEEGKEGDVEPDEEGVEDSEE